MKDLPAEVQDWLGKPVVSIGPFVTAEQGAWLNYCVAVEDANPLYWQGHKDSGDNPLAPPALLPSWVVDHDWNPDPGHKALRTLELHFMLKDALALPYGVVTGVELEFHRPVRSGDQIRAEQVLLDVGEEYLTRMGPGRRWSIQVNYYHRDDALAGIQVLRFVSYRKETKSETRRA